MIFNKITLYLVVSSKSHCLDPICEIIHTDQNDLYLFDEFSVKICVEVCCKNLIKKIMMNMMNMMKSAHKFQIICETH